MYLKRIEAQGFKSFANRMILEFDRGIMGIVGPNGSGKSNVADAVRWVLGEQSAKTLRGSNMQDVIFAGTENRKPQSYASVELIIDNADHMLAIDYDEVRICRRVYRSGESEYRLNGNICRLRDIQELFYDTGVGKEGYSIIGQGQIDKILSSKPEDRRELFDEAAGIVKLKKRKQIACKKLESEEQNLYRVSDVLHELEKQVGPLARQSEKAREYLKQKEELKRWEIDAFFGEIEDLKKKQESLTQKHEIAHHDFLQNQSRGEELKANYDKLEEEIMSWDVQLTQGQEKLSWERVEKESREGQVRVLQEQISSAKKDARQMKERMDFLEEEIGSRIGEKENFIADKQDVEQLCREAKIQLEEKEKEIIQEEEELKLLERQAEKEQSILLEGIQKKAIHLAQRQKFQTQLEQAALKKSEIHRFIFLQCQKEAQQQEKEAAVKRELEGIANNQRKQEEEKNFIERQVREITCNIQNLRKEWEIAQQEYHTIHTKKEELINLTERYEGYGRSIQRIMEKKNHFHGICGVVADLMQTEKQYETAIEIALGGRIQNIVTDNETSAKTLIEYLKKNRLGRATFLPISAVRGGEKFPRPEALRENGVLGVASSLVQVEPRYQGIFSYLLGRILVVDTLDHALVIAQKYGQSLSLVTLEGESLSPGGAMTGGAFKNTSNLLGRRREIEELTQKEKELYASCQEKKVATVSEEERLARNNQNLSRKREEIHQLSLQETTQLLQLRTLREEWQEIQKSRISYENENQQINERMKEIALWENEQNQELSSLAENEEKSQKKVEHLLAMTENKKRDSKKKEEQRANAALALSALRQKDEFLWENICRVNREMERLIEEKAQLTYRTDPRNSGIEEKEEEIQRIQDEIQLLQETIGKIEKEMISLTEKKENAQKTQKVFFREREEVAEQSVILDRELYRLQSQLDGIQEGMDHQVEYLWSEYEMTPSEAQKERTKNETRTLSELRRGIKQRKTGIRELGPVNVNAIEEYRKVWERYEFLNRQHSDLMEARESLLRIIHDLDEGMRKQFREKFAQINQEFDRVFQELFGGGKGTLELIQEENRDVLEAGIAIIAQPPGKKLQNMMQLSGGEKSLTALALLFAIQNLKPSPFCLLDELEAALDEPNVARYAEYLSKLKEHTQFIVITHRRGTMEMADRLYGITMQEKGVSALVSVDLTDPDLVSA